MLAEQHRTIGDRRQSQIGLKIMSTTKCRNGFIMPLEKFPQPLLICSDQYNGLAFGWTCAPNGSEFKIVCANGLRVPAEGAALFALAGEEV